MADVSIKNPLPLSVSKYLNKFGSETWKIETNSSELYSNIVVIPAIQEYGNIKNLLISLSGINSRHITSTLFLVVVNNTVSASSEIIEDNKQTIEMLRAIIHKNSFDDFTSSIIRSEINLGFVDASSKGFEMPDKEGGVGLARKIGMDLALKYFDYNSPAKRILICLDADCIVQQNYLDAIVDEVNENNIEAGYVEYEHKLTENEQVNTAIITYEIFLRYYVLGLKYADSPFAFDTIGSTMLCDAENYVRIGGMNKRKAAEDFYFMEKLGKITPIKKINTTRIFPSARRSWRVPFGTGQRMNRFFAGTHDEFSLIDPVCFEILKKWLLVFMNESIQSTEYYLQQAKIIDDLLYEFLLEQGFVESWNKIVSETKKKEQISKQKYFWFDAFRTMKLIHFLRDRAYPQLNMFDALDKMFGNYQMEIKRDKPIPSVDVQMKYLNVLRKI